MANNWKTLVEKNNAKLYVLPPGWDSKAKIAEQLECSEGNVNRQLAPAIKDKSVEVKVFAVFDTVLKKMTRVTAYRQAEKKT